MSQSLETPEDSLGLAVEGCEKAPDGKHFPDMGTVSGHILDATPTWKLYVIDAVCKHCGLTGSRQVNPFSFNWD